MEEIWKKVPYEGLEYYEVSNFGHVKLLPREVKTRCVTKGKEMIVTAHRQGKDIKVQIDGGRPVVRMTTTSGVRRKFSVPLLMLKMFKMDECPGDVDKYTAAYLDGDILNNNINNLVWVSKAQLMDAISRTTKGEPKPSLVKYSNVVILVDGQIVGYFNSTSEGQELFNSYGINTSSSAIGRALRDGTVFYTMFDFIRVSEEDYERITNEYQQQNLRIIYDIVSKERLYAKKPKTVVEYRDRIVYKPKKEIVEKIVYVDKSTGEKVRKPPAKKTIKSKFISTPTEDKLADIDDSLFYEEQKQLEQEKKNKFKEEMLRRIGGIV